MTLHHIDAGKAISTMVEAMLPRFSNPNLGLLIQLDCRYENYKTKKKIAHLITLIFQRPDNYTKVFSKISDFCENEVFSNKEINMKLKSDHDSCWRSDGFMDINKDWNEAHNKIGHPLDDNVSFHCSFSIFNSPKYIKFEKLEFDCETGDATIIYSDLINIPEIS